jgi:O-antigen/teichoic acid export membrane protein
VVNSVDQARLDLGVESLRQHVARGTIVNGAFLVGLYSLGLIRGFVVAGLLGARAYGVWGIVLVTFSTLLWLKQVGVVDRYVQQDEPDQEVAFQRAFTVEVVVTGAFALAMLAVVPLVATVYGHSELVGPSLVFIATIAVSTLQTPIWIHYRRMNFVRQRALQAIDPLLGFAVTVGLAVAGAGYWSLAVGFAVGALAASLAAVATSPYPLRLRLERDVLRDYLGFSWPLFVASASSLVVAQSPILAGEKLEGVAAVGIIVLAASIANYANRVDEVVTQTLYPAICAVGDRVELLFETFSKSNRLALMWGLPFGIGVALFGSDLVRFGIGEQWRPGVVLIESFGAIAGISHIGFNWDAFYRARGETRPIAIWSFLCMVTFVAIAIPLLAADGLDGLAIGMGAMAVVSLAIRLYYLGRLFPAFDIARHCARAVAPTLVAAPLVLLVRLLLDSDRTLGRALAELALYLAVTAAVTFALERDLLREVVGYLRRGPGRTRISPAGERAAT